MARHTPAAAEPLSLREATAPSAALVASQQLASYRALDRVCHRPCHDAFQPLSRCRRHLLLHLPRYHAQQEVGNVAVGDVREVHRISFLPY